MKPRKTIEEKWLRNLSCDLIRLISLECHARGIDKIEVDTEANHAFEHRITNPVSANQTEIRWNQEKLTAKRSDGVLVSFDIARKAKSLSIDTVSTDQAAKKIVELALGAA